MADFTRKFRIGAESTETITLNHTRNASTANTDSPPTTPQSQFFNTAPLSPPASTTSFSPAHTPQGSLTVPSRHQHHSHAHSSSIPSSLQNVHTHDTKSNGRPSTAPHAPNHNANNSVSTNATGGDVPRTTSWAGSRPTTVDFSINTPPHLGSRPSSTRFREAFSSPRTRPLTLHSVTPSIKITRARPKSTMITPEALDALVNEPKPWMKKEPLGRVAYWLTWGVMLLGLALGGLRCFLGYKQVLVLNEGSLCPVLDEEFNSDQGIFGDGGLFFREVDMSGFGNGQFEMTTDDNENSYVKDGKLYITPTLTSKIIGEDAIIDGHVFNVTGCTFNITKGTSYTGDSVNTGSSSVSAVGSDQALAGFQEAYTKACSAVSNKTSGAIVNPVRSARLSTRLSKSMKYGRVEVRAKIPSGDWLWPAIWMLPVDNTYGGWPLSGEIDIMEARGNGPEYMFQGSDYVRGSLNWGPSPSLNAAWRTYGWWKLKRQSYASDFHTYAMEWDENFIRIYVDNRLHHMLDLRVKRSFWDYGNFPRVAQQDGGSVLLDNPWANGTKTAPFDQKFYLILNVAVGGTGGWFPDGEGKPWYDHSPTAPLEFWRARNEWYPTWTDDAEKKSLIVDSIKMWEKCK